MCMCVCVCVCVCDAVVFQLLLHRGLREGASPFPRLHHFVLDPYLKMVSFKEGGTTYHFLIGCIAITY